MEKTEKKLLATISLATIVIALGTLGIMAVEIRGIIDSPLLPKVAFDAVLMVIAIAALLYTIYAVIVYHHK